MRRTLFVVAVVVAGCSGPVLLDRAIWPVHEQEYAEAMRASASSPREAWYAWRARQEDTSSDAIHSADESLSTTRNPFTARTSPEAVSRGAVIFEHHCARCHGADARGNGPDVLASHPTNDFHGFGKRFAVTLHNGAPRTWFRKIENGYGDTVEYPTGHSSAMPAFGDTLAREQIWYVITYLQSLDIYAQPADGGNAAG